MEQYVFLRLSTLDAEYSLFTLSWAPWERRVEN